MPIPPTRLPRASRVLCRPAASSSRSSGGKAEPGLQEQSGLPAHEYQQINKEVSDPGVVAPVPRVPAHARPEAAVPGRRWQGARHGRRAVAHAPPAAARGPGARAYAPPAARRDAAVVQSPRGEEALARRLRAVAHGPPAAMACEQREAGL
jgi:hypothetical protein